MSPYHFGKGKEFVPMEIKQKTIGRILDRISKKHANNEALIHTDIGVRYNYGLFLWEVNRAARGLMDLGLEKGDRVALWAPNIPEWIIAQMALAKMGAVLVPVGPGAGRDDLQFILEQSDSKAIIMARGLEADEYVESILEVKDRLSSLQHIIVAATQSYPDTIPWTCLAARGEDVGSGRLEEREKEINPEDSVAIMYTSGTTGRPKGVVLDHVGLISKSLSSAGRQGLLPEDRLCLFFPLHHVFGNTCISLTGLLTGATIVMPCLVFDPSRVLRALYTEKCTAIYGSPSMIIGLLEHPEFRKKKWATVRKGTLGGAPCPIDLMKRLVQDVGVAGITVGYGITETSSWITMTHPDDPLELRVSTIGTALDCNEVKIVDPSTCKDVPANGQGEICVRGFLMKGYHKMPGATASAVDKKGWFHSGDLGTRDENGYVRIVGRLKDVITRNGVDIRPTEVEEVLYGLPEVSEVQVFGFEHPEKGREVAAWVKLKQGAALSPEAISRYARRRLSRENMPDHFKLVAGFPMTRSGKVQKFKLAEMARKEYV